MKTDSNNDFFKDIEFNQSELSRIAEAVLGRDSDLIPKVNDAGKIYYDDQYKKFIQVMHNGLKVFTDSHYGKFNVEIIKQLKGHHEPQEELIFYEVLKKIPDNAVMIELGSFWGYYSMWFKSQIQNSINFLVEPMYIDEGIKNFKINNLEGANFIRACVGSKRINNFQFKQTDDRDPNNIRERIVNIPQVSIDSFLSEYSLDYVDILHSDIQGFEVEMLNGAKSALARMKVGYFFISTHGPLLHFKVIDIFKKYNYKIISDFSPRESFTSDGCVIACHPDLFEKKIKITKRSGILRKLKDKIDFLKHILAINGKG